MPAPRSYHPGRLSGGPGATLDRNRSQGHGRPAVAPAPGRGKDPSIPLGKNHLNVV